MLIAIFLVLLLGAAVSVLIALSAWSGPTDWEIEGEIEIVPYRLSDKVQRGEKREHVRAAGDCQ